MRQFFLPRFWLTLVALGALTLATWLVLRDDVGSEADSGGAATRTHRIDIVELVFAVRAAPNFAMNGGVVQGELRLLIDGTRTMVIQPGTPGEITCQRLAELGNCVVAADLLGEAVLWFSLIPAEPRATVVLPAPRQLLGDGWLLLANGWEVRHAASIERSCADDTPSLDAFIERYGNRATSTFDLERQRVVRVTCPG
jgi:hypothetical protein